MYETVKTFHGPIQGEVIEGTEFGATVVRDSSGEIYERWIDGNFYKK